MPLTGSVSRRDRLRAETSREIGALALAQVAAGGPRALSLTGIARQMGLSGPALYRYYDGRDALLARLVADVFGDLADALDRALAHVREDRPDGALRTVAAAYRRWALAHPREYVLITAGVPLEQPRADLEAATRRALDRVVAAVVALAPDPAAAAGEPPAWLVPHAVVVWQRLHGHLALELEGIHAAMGLEPDAIFASEVGALVEHTRERWDRAPAP